MLTQDKELSYYLARVICKKILESNFNIRSATICRDDGTIICTDYRQNKKSTAAHAEGQASLIRASARFFNRKMHEKIFGKITFSLTLHEKIARVAIPLNDKYVVLISVDKDADHTDIIMTDIYPAIQKAEI
jgi:hypothetical protein